MARQRCLFAAAKVLKGEGNSIQVDAEDPWRNEEAMNSAKRGKGQQDKQHIRQVWLRVVEYQRIAVVMD